MLLSVIDRVTGGELFDEIVAREFYSEHDARCVSTDILCQWFLSQARFLNAYWVVVIWVKLWMRSTSFPHQKTSVLKLIGLACLIHIILYGRTLTMKCLTCSWLL